MAIIIGSARHDENNKYSGGKAGDNTQVSSTNDMSGEVSMQTMYTHSKGWYILRPKSTTHAAKMAELMIVACNNAHIGYDQGNRNGIIKYGINTTTDTECDCSSLVREDVKEATGTDPGDFYTGNEVSVLEATGLFEDAVAYVSQTSTPVYNGDVLVTKSKGHTVIVCSGNPRTGTSDSSSAVSKTKTAAKAASYYDKSLAGSYTTTAALNMRNGAGAANSSMVILPKGTVVKNYGYYSLSGTSKWLYVQVTYKGVQYTGFCSAKYLSK